MEIIAMKTLKGLAILVACALVVGGTAANASPYVVTFEQMGLNVVATGSGNIDLTGLTLSSLHSNFTAGINPPEAVVSLNSGTSVDTYSGTFSGPPGGIGGPGFGPGTGLFEVASGTGNFVSFSLTFHAVHVFHGYVSDDPLGTSTDTWDNATFASLGLTPGTYEWTWGTTDADQSFTIDIAAPTTTPLPAALPLFASGLGVMGFLAKRRKRKSGAAIAA
jgi:hypothetical protein